MFECCKYTSPQVDFDFRQPPTRFRHLTATEEREIDEMMAPIMKTEAEIRATFPT